MNSRNFTEEIVNRLREIDPEIKIDLFWNGEKSLIKGYPHQCVDIEFKPNNTGQFVVWLKRLEFFNFPLLEEYLKSRLNTPIANYILTSKCIYVYPKNQQSVTESMNSLTFCCNILRGTIEMIESTMKAENKP